MLGKHAVADVAAFAEEEVVEREADGCPADDFPGHVGHQEGARHEAWRQVAAVPLVLHRREVVRPPHSRLVLDAEPEPVAFHRGVPGSEGGLVILPQRPQPEPLHRCCHRARLTSRPRILT